MTIPPLLDKVDLPNLSHLSIDNCSPLLVRSALRPTLKTLILRFACIPFLDMLDFLACVPDLGELLLMDAVIPPFRRDPPIIPAVTRSISLPKLRTLSLSDRQSWATMPLLFTHLDIPQDVHVSVSFPDRSTSVDPATVLRIFISKLPRTQAREIEEFRPRSIEMSSFSWTRLSVRLWARPQIWRYSSRDDRSKTSDSPNLSINIIGQDMFAGVTSEVLFDEIISTIFGMLNLQELSTLSLVNMSDVPGEWCLPRMKHLETLMIRDANPRCGISRTIYPSCRTQDRVPYTPLPNLQTLEIADMLWKECITREATFSLKYTPSRLLVTALLERVVQGLTKLQLLLITRPHGLSPADVEVLSCPAHADRCIVTGTAMSIEERHMRNRRMFHPKMSYSEDEEIR
ncbi:hypothetical protein EIP86_011182 [Pleurotus ostreatoroseus]|nr:hypothetical protein EIP86_011182 [Pleurotus ostreatoroseus]